MNYVLAPKPEGCDAMVVDSTSRDGAAFASRDVGPTALTFAVWRVGAWLGLVYMVVGLLAWGVVAKYLPAPRQSLDADGIKAFFVNDEYRIRAGMIVYICIGPLYAVFSIVLSRLLQRIEGPHGILYQVEFFGGLLTAIVTQLSGVLWLTASFRTETRSPQDVQLLSDAGWFVFDMTFTVTLLQFVAFGIVVLVDRRATPLFPRWIAWLSFFVATTFLPLLVMPFLNTGPFAWNGLFNYWIALGGFFAWILAVFRHALTAISRVEREMLG
jgi:hypothetical protein